MSLRALEGLAQDFAAAHPQEAAHLLSGLPAQETSGFLDSCPAGVAAGTARFMTAQELVAVLRCLPPERAARLLEPMPRELVASSFRRLDKGERRPIADLLPTELKRSVQALLRYREGSAGAWMEPVVLTVSSALKVESALDVVRGDPSHLRYYVYVVDDDEQLVGVVSLRSLMCADRDSTVASVMDRQLFRISARAGREAILQHHGWAEVHALPVVDERNTLVGVLRYETLQRLAREERRQTAGETPMVALAELFWVGSQRVLSGLFDLVQREPA